MLNALKLIIIIIKRINPSEIISVSPKKNAKISGLSDFINRNHR